MTSCSVSRKGDPELRQAPASQAIPRDTDHLRPSNLAAKTLRVVEHAPSKFGHDPCSVRRGLVAAATCCVRQARFFRCPGRLWRSQSLAWVSTPRRRQPVLFSDFRSHNRRPHARCKEMHNVWKRPVCWARLRGSTVSYPVPRMKS